MAGVEAKRGPTKEMWSRVSFSTKLDCVESGRSGRQRTDLKVKESRRGRHSTINKRVCCLKKTQHTHKRTRDEEISALNEILKEPRRVFN